MPVSGTPFTKDDLEIELIELTISIDPFGRFEVEVRNLTTGEIRRLFEPTKMNSYMES